MYFNLSYSNPVFQSLEESVEKEKSRIASMKFSLRALSDGGTSSNVIGQLSESIDQLEARLKGVEEKCRESLRKLGEIISSKPDVK